MIDDVQKAIEIERALVVAYLRRFAGAVTDPHRKDALLRAATGVETGRHLMDDDAPLTLVADERDEP